MINLQAYANIASGHKGSSEIIKAIDSYLADKNEATLKRLQNASEAFTVSQMYKVVDNLVEPFTLALEVANYQFSDMTTLLHDLRRNDSLFRVFSLALAEHENGDVGPIHVAKPYATRDGVTMHVSVIGHALSGSTNRLGLRDLFVDDTIKVK